MDSDYDEPPFVHQKGASGNTYMAVELSKGLPLMVALCCMAMLVSGIALGMALWARDRADTADRTATVAKLRTEGFTRALIAKGIDPYPHLEGEDP